MNSEPSDPFDGASPILGHAQVTESYDDLLGAQVPVEDFDLAMPDFADEYTPLLHTAPIASMTNQDDQNPGITEDREGLGAAMTGLCNLDWSTLDTTTNSANNDTDPVKGQASRLNKEPFKIKEEVADWPFTLRVPVNTIDNPIELSDTEDPDSIYKHGTKMSDGVIVLSDGEDPEEISIFADGSTSVAVKTEDPDVQLSGATVPFPQLGKSFLGTRNPRAKHTAADIERMRQMQRLYTEKALAKNLGSEDRRTLAAPKASHSSGPDSHGQSSNDENAWMKDVVVVDDAPATNFPSLKKAYKVKVTKGSNTVYDDIEFVRAEKAEKLRLARLKAEYEHARGYGEDDNSDDGLFISPLKARTTHSKRRAVDDLDGEDESADSRIAKQRKQIENSEQIPRDLDLEQETYLVAGLEEFIHKRYGKDGEKSGKKGKGKGRFGGWKRTNRRSNKTGCLNDLNSLLTSNVYEDADANLDREALPVSGHTNKQKALAALVASVPLGTTPEDATSEKNRILKATVTLGRNIKGACKLDGQDRWKIPGIRTSLRHHQVLAAGFMKERETGGEEPLGGILADSMGTGKTLDVLALMVTNPPPRDEKHRATLIVCTPGLLVQWEREIEKHTEAGHLDLVLKHHSANRVSGKGAASVMHAQDIILTTYQEVVKSCPRIDPPEDIHDEGDLRAWWKKQCDQEKDVLHQVQFYRVVLDESQAIKNYKSQASIACRALMAKYKWCCSGTPISNNLEELYPYFEFLRVPCTGSFSEFQENYCDPGSDDCNSRLHCLLEQIMCRRTLKDTILGEPIVKLPKHNQSTIKIEFSPVEKALYRLVLKKYVGTLNKASADGMLEKYVGFGLVGFLRLRQMCSHMFLVQEVLETLLDIESIDNMERELICGATLENRNDRNLLIALRRMIEAKPKVDEELEEPEQERTGELAARFGSYLKTLKVNFKWAELRSRTQCQSCRDPPESAVVTSCLHVYCEECLVGLANKASANDQDKTSCLACGVVFTGAEPCAGLKELELNNHFLLNSLASRKTVPKKVNLEWVFHQNKLVMSAKTTAVQVQIEKWLEEEPDKKIIIFSQFHFILQVLEKVCEKKRWSYCTYNGKMSHEARDRAIRRFTEESDMKIMVASLKCGGIGLNLTMASKVVCIDLWYNSCVEQQAFCRVFRIGQEAETFITRFVVVVEGSADGKLMDMQGRKNALIARALDDRSVMSKLTTDDVLRLFGEVRLDKDKRPFVHLDDDEKLDSLFEKKDQ